MRKTIAILFICAGWVLVYSVSLRLGLGLLLMIISAKLFLNEAD